MNAQQLARRIPQLLGATLAAAATPHECTTGCPDPCPMKGRSQIHDPFTLPADTVLLESFVDSNGARVIHTMPLADLATMLDPGSGVATISYATASAVLAAKKTAGNDTGLQRILDKWHAAGVLP